MVLVTPDPRNLADKAQQGLCGLPPFIEVHQLLSGREFASSASNSQNPVMAFAAQMANYVYAVIDRRDASAVLVDPCWDVEGIFNHVCADLGAKSVTAAVYVYVLSRASRRHFMICPVF